MDKFPNNHELMKGNQEDNLWELDQEEVISLQHDLLSQQFEYWIILPKDISCLKIPKVQLQILKVRRRFN